MAAAAGSMTALFSTCNPPFLFFWRCGRRQSSWAKSWRRRTRAKFLTTRAWAISWWVWIRRCLSSCRGAEHSGHENGVISVSKSAQMMFSMRGRYTLPGLKMKMRSKSYHQYFSRISLIGGSGPLSAALSAVCLLLLCGPFESLIELPFPLSVTLPSMKTVHASDVFWHLLFIELLVLWSTSSELWTFSMPGRRPTQYDIGSFLLEGSQKVRSPTVM